MKDAVRAAFLAVRNDYPPDRVVVDPELNQAFLQECTRKGVAGDPARLNRCLLNLRKAGMLKGLKRSRRTSFPNEEDYRFASEIAARYMERAHHVSLDAVLTDPALAREFDNVARNICPGYTTLQYRWAALNLRKARNLAPEIVSHAFPNSSVRLGRLSGVDTNRIPTTQGLYVFYESRNTLYVGESANLRHRIEKHVEHSDNKFLARWFWQNGSEDVHLEVHLLPCETTTRMRRALESELIESRRPAFNVRRGA